jgi:NAD(P) transhydrogenase
MKYDLIVIGSGPAGQKAAIAAAKSGHSVAIIDRKTMLGGVALHGGTIPSKTLREAIIQFSGLKERAFYGDYYTYTAKGKISQEDLKTRVRNVEEHEMRVIHDQLKRNRIEMYFGTAYFENEHRVAVVSDDMEKKSLEGEKILIACGTRPARHPGIPFDGETIIDVDQILDLKEIPDEMIVVGAGIIGLEYASMFAALGVEVTIIERNSAILGFVDQEIIERLIYHLRNLNMTFRLGETVRGIAKDEKNRVVASLESGKKIKAQTLLYAVGRQTNADSLNLEAIGLETHKHGRIRVNGNYQTDVAHIYAAGDVIGFPALASASMDQGRLASCHMFAGPGTSCALTLLPYGIYTIPEISMIGKTEQELTEMKIPYEFGAARFDELAKGGIMGVNIGYLKILFDPESLKLLGVHIVGETATELIHIGQAVLSLGATIEYFRDTVFNYPTLAEAYKVAALDGLNKQ